VYLVDWAIEGNFYLAQKYEIKRHPMKDQPAIPKSLQKGDAIALVAPSRKIHPEEIAVAEGIIRNWGFQPVHAPDLFASDHQYGGDAATRAASFNWAIHQTDIRAIWAVRGGYGAVQVMPLIDWAAFQKHPKWICGYSDFTVMLSAAVRHGVAGLHATMPINFAANDAQCLEVTKDILFGKWNNLSWPVAVENRKFQRVTGQFKGRLVGGNLSVLYSQRGTLNDLDPRGAILFLEDLDEYLYHIDRMLQNLKLGEWFQSLTAVIAGGLTQMHDNTIPFGQSPLEILRSALPSSVPLAVDAPVGHLSANYPLVMGVEATLDIASDSNMLSYG